MRNDRVPPASLLSVKDITLRYRVSLNSRFSLSIIIHNVQTQRNSDLEFIVLYLLLIFNLLNNFIKLFKLMSDSNAFSRSLKWFGLHVKGVHTYTLLLAVPGNGNWKANPLFFKI